MCGITGIIDLQQPVSRNLLKKMTDVQTHRGPNDDGYFFSMDNSVALGFRRLCILDLLHGQQPLANENNDIHLVFNGEIYNYRKLRENLLNMGHTFRTETDSECIVHGYEEYGEDVFSRLNGMFAIAIWDNSKKKLLLARDRIGEKPLHYYFKDNLLIFASEIKSILLHPRVNKTLNPDAVVEFFSYGFISAPLSIYNNIKKIAPGTYLIFEKNQVRQKGYWQLDLHKKFSGDYQEAKKECLRLLTEAVRIRMYSDVPLGAFLSGGIDSATVVALMSQFSRQPVKTFSIGFNESDYDETAYAKKVADRYKTDHTELTLTKDFSQHLKKILLNFDEPFGDASALPTFFLAQLTREHVTVALSGDGGDEVFAGYNTYGYMVEQIRKVKRWPKISLMLARNLHKYFIGNNFLDKRIRILGQQEPYRFISLMTVFNQLAKSKLFSKEVTDHLNNRLNYGLEKKLVYFNKDIDFIKSMQYSDLKHYLADDILVKVDRTTMLASLESRTPFLDPNLIEFAFSLPSEWKLKDRKSKLILKDIMEPLLPKEVITRNKMGFGIPMAAWLNQNLMDSFRETLSSPEAGAFFNRNYIDRIIKDHFKYKNQRTFEIWLIFSFLIWLNANKISF